VTTHQTRPGSVRRQSKRNVIARTSHNRSIKLQLIHFRTQTQHERIAHENRTVNHISEPELFTRSNVSYIELARKLDRQLLLRNLSEVRIRVRRNSVLTHNTGNGHVVFHNRQNFSIAKLVANDLCLRQWFAIRGCDLN